jgi:CheY-like chemotaxis protein
LLVEDEPADAHLVKVALRENRLLVDLHTACDGVEALQFLRHQDRYAQADAAAPRPDLILLDLNMPRMNGREFISVIKADPALADIPVVVLTTSDVERDVIASYQLRAAGYITKPVDIEQFSKAIRCLGDYWFSLVRLPGRGA